MWKHLCHKSSSSSDGRRRTANENAKRTSVGNGGKCDMKCYEVWCCDTVMNSVYPPFKNAWYFDPSSTLHIGEQEGASCFLSFLQCMLSFSLSLCCDMDYFKAHCYTYHKSLVLNYKASERRQSVASCKLRHWLDILTCTKFLIGYKTALRAQGALLFLFGSMLQSC